MDNVLTVEEIRERFRSEWVLLGDPQTAETLAVQAGTVLCHSKDRDEVSGQPAQGPGARADRFPGPWPHDSSQRRCGRCAWPGLPSGADTDSRFPPGADHPRLAL
jgi:hypothetical protein